MPCLTALQVFIVSSAAEASAAAPPGGSVSVVVSEGLQLLLPLAGLFDVEKELKRLDKQKQKVRSRRGRGTSGTCSRLSMKLCVHGVLLTLSTAEK